MCLKCPPMPALEEVKLKLEEAVAERFKLKPRERKKKAGKGLKILTPNKLIIKLPTLLAQIKTRNNPYQLKNEIRQIMYLLYQHNKITKKVCNNLIKLL